MFGIAPSFSRFFVAVAALQAFSSLSSADVIGAEADTFLETGNLPFGTATGAPGYQLADELWVYDNGGAYHAVPLLRFDLASYAGKTVEGDATLTLHVRGMLAGAQRDLEFISLTGSFDPETATFQNSNGLVAGSSLGTFAVTPIEGEPLTFTLSAATLQSWIDSPASNFGFAIIAKPPRGQDIYFHSSESPAATRPTLTFTVVPEPSSAMLAGVGLLALARRRRSGRSDS